ncbi:15190_t:CDS:10, partial [Entrophospora sp. SA101]
AKEINELLEKPTFIEAEQNNLLQDLCVMLNKKSSKDQLIMEMFHSTNNYFREFCVHGTKTDCKKNRKTARACNRLHFRPMLRPHTELELGDCSYLNTCHRMDTCKYVHYELDDDEEKWAFVQRNEIPSGVVFTPPTKVLPPQWINCDVRKFDFSILGKFTVIMADPPWDIHMTLPYGTMTDDEMKAMAISELQDEGLIFLWVTGRAMELGRECLAIWGYDRADELVWIKTNQLQRLIRTGRTGHWLNHSKEHCLVGIKGNPEGLNWGLDCDVLVGEVRETSRKPDEIYGIIDRLAPGTRKLDYLDPQFRSHLMTKKCLMEILTKYNIPCKPSMKKSEIVEIFERNKKRLQSLTFDNETGHSTDQESNNSDDNNEVDNGNESDTTVVSYNEIPSKITGSYIINGTTTIIQEQHTTITQRQPATTTQRQPSTIQEQLATITQDRLSSLSSNNANEPPPPNIVDEPSSNNADESPPSNIVDESPSNNVNESPSINDIERSPSLRVIYGNTSHELHYNLPRYCGAGTKFNSNDYFRRTNRRLNLKVYNESEWIQKKNILKSIVLIIIMALLFCHRVKNSTGYCHNGDSNLICTPCPDSSKCIGGRIVSCDDGYKLSKSIFSLYDMTSTYCKAEMSAKEKTAFYSETLKKAATTQSQNNMVCGNGVKNTMLLHNLKSRIRDQMYEDSDEIFENFIRHGLEALKNDHDLIIREYGIK